VFVTALRIVQDLGEAEDVMQVVFFEIFQKAVQFDPAKGNLCNWILQYAYHRSIDRKSYLTLRQFYNHIELEAAGGEDIWITRVILPPQEASRLVSESLALLNGQQREVMELVFFRELTLREVAEETKQSVGSVRHHYYRGLKRLRSHFSAASNGNERPAIAPCEKGVRANA
jgi:RNA polymerase sigma-70 factor (ECF subfamily)